MPARYSLALAALFGGLFLIGCAKPADNGPPQVRVEDGSAKAAKDKPKPADTPKGAPKDTPADPPKKDTPKTEDPPKDKDKSDTPPPKSDGSRGGPDGAPPPPPPAPPVAGGAGPRRVALLVGIAKYDSEVGDLLYSENDVTKLAEALKTGGYKDADVVVMTSTAGEKDKALLPTAANITTKLDAVLGGLKKDDVVLVAFAGHGVQPAGDKAYFCAYQTRLNDTKTMVAIDDVIAKLNKSAATTKIILVDACRNTLSRAPKERKEADVTDLATVTGRDGTATIAYFSCDKGEKSWEVDELQHGVFFAQVISALRGAADSYPDGQVTWGELVDYVQRNINFHNSKFAAKKQTPHFRGEVRNAAPLVVRPAAAKVDVGKADATPAAASDDAVNEDFRGVDSGGLPRGWTGPAFTRTYDEKAFRACVELRRKNGEHGLSIPFARPLAGNFAFEIEFRLAGLTSKDYQRHALALTLEGEGGVLIPVRIEHDGDVLFADTKSGTTGKFRPDAINRLKLVRTDDESYTLYLNDGDAASTRIKYAGQINGLRVVVAHQTDGRNRPPLVTRLYSVKAGSARPGDPAKVGKVVIDEDFHARPAGAVLPAGWDGPAFSVATDEAFDLKALEVNKADSKIYWVTVPKLEATLGKGRPFALDVDVRLSGYYEGAGFNDDRPQAQELYLRLEGPGTLPLTVVLDAYGRARLSGEKETRAKWFGFARTNRVRLIQQNGVVEVLVNGVSVVASKRPPGDYAELALGVVGGVPRDGFAAKLYGVRLTALPGKEQDVTPLRAVAEDFLRAGPDGPKGWAGQNVVCRHAYGREGNLLGVPSVQLTDPGKPGAVVVPFKPYDLKLDGDFAAAVEFYHYNLDDSTLAFGLHGAGKGQALEVAMFYKDGKYWLQVRNNGTPLPAANVTQIVDYKKPSVFGVERVGAAVSITLNGQAVGKVPVGKTPVTYEGAKIDLVTKARGSPQLNRVFVVAK